MFGSCGMAAPSERGSPAAKFTCAAAVPDNRRALTDREGERLEQLDLVAALRKSGANVSRNRLLHLYIAALEGILRETRLLQRSLHIHAVINDVGDELRVRLRLVPAAHDAEADVHVALLHERRDDGVERTLVSGKRIGQAGRELKTGAAILEREAEPRGDEAGAIAGVVALNERDDVPVLVDGGEIDGGVAMLVKFRRDIGRERPGTAALFMSMSFARCSARSFEMSSLTGTGVKRGSPTYLYMSA